MDELDRLAAVLAIGVVVVHVRRHRPRPIERDERGDVVEAGGCQGANECSHGCRLELEHADRVAPLEELERRLVVEHDCVDVEIDPLRVVDELEAVRDDIKVSKPKEVHLEQSEVFDAVHLVLGDNGCLLKRLAGFGLALDREVFG